MTKCCQAEKFVAYGPSHWAVIAVFVLGSAVLVWIGRHHASDRAALLFSRILGVTTLVLYLASMSFVLVPPRIESSVPLRLTDLATLAAAYALWSHRRWAYALTYYWCLVLSAQAIVTPVLTSPDFPNHEFLAFWSIHLMVVWAAIYLTWGLGMRPDWRSFRIVVLATLAWAAVTMTFNSIAGSNYGFLNVKPSTASLLDVFGPWPWYVLVAATVVVAMWALMTWPWVRTNVS